MHISRTGQALNDINIDNSYIRGAFNKLPDFFVQVFKIAVDFENSVCYCYTSYEMTDQFLWFQVQKNTYSSNWNTPY